MTDPVEAVGQAVQQEAANELVRAQRHELGCVAVGVIAPAEGNACVVGADQAAVGDGDTVRIAAEIGEDVLGRTERRLCIDDPALLAQRAQCLGEVVSMVQSRECAEEMQSPGRMRCLQSFEEQPPEQPREDMDGQEESRTAGSQRPSAVSAPPETRQWL